MRSYKTLIPYHTLPPALSLWEAFPLFNSTCWASLVAQWLTVRLPIQGTRVRAPVREDPICRGVAGPMSHGR